MSTEHSPLLPTGRALRAPPSIKESLCSLFEGKINLLLLAVPVALLAEPLGFGSTASFVVSFVALMPLAGLLGVATEQCALTVGQTVGGLLNATFGNAVEAIVGAIALFRGEFEILKTSMLGSILSNLLLVLGCSFISAGFKRSESQFQATAAQASSSLLLVSAAAFIIPAVFVAVAPGSTDALLSISRLSAVVLLGTYLSYLYFQLRSHAYLFAAEEDEDEHQTVSLPVAIGALITVTIITAFTADVLVASVDEFAQHNGVSKKFIGLVLIAIVGNAAEHVSSVWMAYKGKMEICIGVSVGSSIQIGVGVVPALVLLGQLVDRPLTMFFGNFETAALAISVLLVTVLIMDGKSNYLEGVTLIGLYTIVAVASWFL